MKFFKYLSFGCLGLMTALGETPSKEDFSDIDTFLNQNEKQRGQRVKGQVQVLANQLNAALVNDATLLSAYKEAYAEVNFDGVKKEHAMIKAWEEQNRLTFKEDAFLWALRSHVKYLLATLAKKSGEDQMGMAKTMDWIQSFPNARDKFEKISKQALLTAPLSNSVFLKASNQEGITHGISNWYVGDLTNVSEMHRVNVIGFLRSKKDPRIFDQWIFNIQLEQAMVERDDRTAKKEYFQMQRHAWLLWQMGRDYALYGERRKALELMKGILSEKPLNDHWENIEADMRRIMKGEAEDSIAKKEKP